ncbi:MAG: serine hydroxymethyltransferase [Planctomycetota bacterium]
MTQLDAPTDPHASLQQTDPDVAAIVAREENRQAKTLEMIASENHVSPAVMAAVGSCLTNKYAEGYPGKRYYSGCVHHDEVETLAIERAKALFGCGYANVQPHSGASANIAVFLAMLQPGDTFLSIELSDGGHLTHGSRVNMSGKWFKPVHYPLADQPGTEGHERIDYDAVRALAVEHKPKLIICGYSAYPRTIDFAKFRAVADEVGAFLLADIAHIAGLVAGGAHPSPFPHCHVVSTTTHKTLRGPRGGLLLTDDADIAKKLDKAVFPGSQGGPLMHVIAGKAVAFGEALSPEFKAYAQQIVANAKAFAQAMTAKGLRLVSGGTDNHLVLVDLRQSHPDVTGKDASAWLDQAGIIANQNTVPGDERGPMTTSGVRLGLPALTTRGLTESDMPGLADLVYRVIDSASDEATLAAVRSDVEALAERFPMPH